MDDLSAGVGRATARTRRNIATSHVGAAVIAAAARLAGGAGCRRRRRDAQMSLMIDFSLLQRRNRVAIVLIGQSRSGSRDGMGFDLMAESVEIVVIHGVLTARQMEQTETDSTIE